MIANTYFSSTHNIYTLIWHRCWVQPKVPTEIILNRRSISYLCAHGVHIITRINYSQATTCDYTSGSPITGSSSHWSHGYLYQRPVGKFHFSNSTVFILKNIKEIPSRVGTPNVQSVWIQNEEFLGKNSNKRKLNKLTNSTEMEW